MVVVSDESEKEWGCTYGLIVYFNGQIITKSEVVPNHYEEANLYHTEIDGLLGVLQVVIVLQGRGKKFTEVFIVADNEAAIDTGQLDKVKIGAAEYDLFRKLFQL